MKKYGERVEKRHKTHPDRQAQLDLSNAVFAKQSRDEFFDEAYSIILWDFFEEWLKTEPHESKSREHLYNCAMALGSIKDRLIKIETRGANIPVIQGQKNEK